MIHWKQLDSVDQLDLIFEDSFVNPQAIFKHSTTCPISHMAKNRLETGWSFNSVTPYYLDLKVFRSISNEVASKWDVHHESPQIIIIKDGKAVFDESHLDIHIENIHQSLS